MTATPLNSKHSKNQKRATHLVGGGRVGVAAGSLVVHWAWDRVPLRTLNHTSTYSSQCQYQQHTRGTVAFRKHSDFIRV
jgi:hypothetical protein